MSKKRTIEITIAGYTFSLKNLKVHPDVSDETTNFSADLVCNGKHIAFCHNNGQGGSTAVVPVAPGSALTLMKQSLNAISTIRDEEYEKEVNALCKQYSSVGDVAPFVQYWTPEHLCDVLQERQSDWDYAVKQLKKFAKSQPSDWKIWFNGTVVMASPSQPYVNETDNVYEDVTQWVR